MTDPVSTPATRRTEREIFHELAAVCTSQGYSHAIAYLCFRDNIVRYAGEMTAEDMAHMSSMKRLSRTEISTLIGLMVKSPIDFTMPSPRVMQEYITRTDHRASLDIECNLPRRVESRKAVMANDDSLAIGPNCSWGSSGRPATSCCPGWG